MPPSPAASGRKASIKSMEGNLNSLAWRRVRAPGHSVGVKGTLGQRDLLKARRCTQSRSSKVSSASPLQREQGLLRTPKEEKSVPKYRANP